MRHALIAVALLLGLPLTVAACLWDRDTPAAEAMGRPEVVAALTGRFPRNPPLFYEMRLARVAAHLRDHPDDLAAYDDAGVACDRLGRGDDAIGWMGRKRAELDRRDGADPAVREHRYRYHANLGTSLAHRWIRAGADRGRVAEVRAARAEIARALAINPNAHFGREAYQLRALDWIADPPVVGKAWQSLPNLLGWSFDDIYGEQTEPADAAAAARGLAGLVVLGDAWESVDVFHALNVALQRDSVGHERGREGGRNTLAYLAWLRCRELVASGRGSLLPGSPRGEALLARLPRPDFVKADLLLDPAFRDLRTEADAWQAARLAFMTPRLRAGRHPDTDPRFWDGYADAPAPGLPTRSVPAAYLAWQAWRDLTARAVLFGVPTLLVATIAGGMIVRSRRGRPGAVDRAGGGQVAGQGRPDRLS